MSKLRTAIEAELEKKLGDGSTLRCVSIACSELARKLEPALGYDPSPTHVSRVMGALGWIKSIRGGRVIFTRPSAEAAA